MKRIAIAVLFLLGMAAAEPARAQVSTADSAAVLLGVANRLRAEGRISLANSLLDLILQQYASTPSAAEAQRLRNELRGAPEEPSGKTELLVFSTTYGLALGALVPAAFEADAPEIYGLGLIVGGPTGYLLGRQLLRSRPISSGQANAISFGTFWGAWQAVGWTQVLGHRQRCDFDFCFDDGPSATALLRAGLLGSAAGLATGAYLARKEISAGTAATVSFGALWGTWYAFGLGILADQEDDGERLMTIALIGGDVGLVTTALMAPKWNLSRNRARLISISGVAGLLAGAGALLILQADGNEQIIIPMVTSAVGLGLGVGWTRNYDERSGSREQPPGEALLDRSGGSWRLGMPELSIRALDVREGGRRRYEPGIHVPLLRARF
ncbi:MAG: hypothetical protein WEE89_06570 [Gemmatimonadota bacterium]